MPVPGHQTKSERTRQRILDAAAEVFADRGFEARLSDVAARAGMKAGSLYYHFSSRDELVGEILRLGIETSWDHVASAVGRLPPSATPLERLAAAIRAHTRSVVGLSAYASAQARIVHQLPTDLARAHRKDMQDYGAYWHDLFEAARKAGQIDGDVDLVVVRMLAFGAMNWTPEWFRASDDDAVERLADQAVRLLLDGVAADVSPAATTNGASPRRKNRAASTTARARPAARPSAVRDD